MLTKGERHEILRVLRTCLKFGFFPGKVDLFSWELQPLANRKKIWKYRFCFFLSFLHAIYKIGSLANACLFHADTVPRQEMIIHFCLAAGGPVYLLWYYVLFAQYPGVFALYFKMTLTGRIGGEEMKDGEPRSWSRRMREFSLQDWYVMCLPYMVSPAIGTIMVALMCYPSMKLLLYNAVPKEFRTWGVFGILLLEELRFMASMVCSGVLVWTLQVIAFDLLNNQLKLLTVSMQSAAHNSQNFKRPYKSFRCMQLYVSNVNIINRFVIFSWKVLCISVCIGVGYAAIAHFSDYPIFGVMYYMILLNCAFIYIFNYGKAFKIPVLFEEARRSALLGVRSHKSPASKIFKMQVRSIPRMGIQVGEFHMMERQSTLIFIHFVLHNIVTLLVASRSG